jgi:hypothetical protein
LVRAQHVEAPIAGERRRLCHRVEHPLDGWPQIRCSGETAFARRRLAGAGEVEEVRAFGVV